MPELPEVELTMRHLLDCGIVGKTIADIHFDSPTLPTRQKKLARTQSHLSSRLFDVLGDEKCMAQIGGAVHNGTISAIERVGKYLLCSIGTSVLMLHLGMSGKLFMHTNREAVAQSQSIAQAQQLSGRSDIRILFRFADGSCLTFCDARMFGSIAICTSATEVVGHLGVDALTGKLSAEQFGAATSGRRCSVKTLLLSQRPIAGLGNIYCDEALWLAKIHPEQRVCDITKRRINRLLSAIHTVLHEAIINGGTNLQDGVHGFESPYITSINQQHIKVYGRAGQHCKRCKEVIIKYQFHQRGTHYCPSCQVVATNDFRSTLP